MTSRIAPRSKGSGFARFFSLSLALVACGEPGEPLQTTELHREWLGTLSKVIVEGQGPNSGAHYFLKVKGGRQVLELSFETPPASVTGTDLAIEGFLSESRFHVTGYNVIERTLDEPPRMKRVLTAGTVRTGRTVGVVAVDANEDGMNVSNDVLHRLLLDANNPGPLLGTGDTDKSARQYYSEVSYGGYHLRGAVEGPIPWNGSACIGGSEDAAIVLRDDLSATYDSYVWYFGAVDQRCGYAWGEEGTWSRPAENSWFNGRFDATVFSHELGHNIGLMHASSLSCGDEPFADDPLTCTSREYGNPYSVMGSGGVRHLNAIEKWYLSWFTGCNGIRVRQSGTWTLLPIELPCNGIQVLQIPMPKTTRTFRTEQSEAPIAIKHYYLELRTSRGLDTGMTAEVLVHVSGDVNAPTEPCERTALVDMDPKTKTFDGLHAGEGYTDPTGELTFRVESLDDDKARVTVTMANNAGTTTCLDGTVLIGPGPNNCEAPYLVAGIGGASGNGETRPNGGADNRDRTAHLGGATASSNPTIGGAISTDDVNIDETGDCRCHIGGPRSFGTRVLGWATFIALLWTVGRRKAGRRSPVPCSRQKDKIRLGLA